MIRATTIGVLKNYRYGLNNSFIKQNDARTTVLTHRNFNSFADDPSAAARSFQLRRARMTAESQKTVCDTSLRRFETAWASLYTVVDRVDNDAVNSVKNTDLQGINGPVGDAVSSLGQQLDILADTIVQVMNNKYGDDFLFSGADGQTAPFTWGEDGELLFRGIPVDSAPPETLTAQNAAGEDVKISLKLDADGNYDPDGTESYLVAGKSALVDYDPANVPANALKDAAGNPVVLDKEGKPFANKAALDDAAAAGETCSYVTVEEGGTISKEDYDKEADNAEKLRYLSEDEKLFMDIGLGNKEDENGNLISSTAFDSTLQGINFLGFGKDADGDPKNIVSLVKKMAKICSNADGALNDSEWNEVNRLVGKTEIASDKLHDQHVKMDARSTKLKNNLELLEGSIDTLTEQYSELEDVDDADAISAFLWASYSYNAALRVGNSILSQSLMDYMQ